MQTGRNKKTRMANHFWCKCVIFKSPSWGQTRAGKMAAQENIEEKEKKIYMRVMYGVVIIVVWIMEAMSQHGYGDPFFFFFLSIPYLLCILASRKWG